MVLAHFNNYTCAIPLVWVGAGLVLESHSVTNTKWCEGLGVLTPTVLLSHVTVSQCFFSKVQGFSPSLVWAVLVRQYWDKIFDRSSEDAHCWREFCGWVWGVSILENCSLKCVDINCAVFPSVASDHSLYGFDAYFSSAIAVWKCYRTEAVVDSPIF